MMMEITMNKLQGFANEIGIVGFSNMNKTRLIKEIISVLDMSLKRPKVASQVAKKVKIPEPAAELTKNVLTTNQLKNFNRNKRKMLPGELNEVRMQAFNLVNGFSWQHNKSIVKHALEDFDGFWENYLGSDNYGEEMYYIQKIMEKYHDVLSMSNKELVGLDDIYGIVFMHYVQVYFFQFFGKFTLIRG
jgi:hypothetical protein